MSSKAAVVTFGVRERTRNASMEDQHAEDIRIAGFTIVPSILSADELVLARTKMDRVYDLQTAEIGGREALITIGDPYTAMCLVAYDDFFLPLVKIPVVLSVVQRLLGEHFCVMLDNGILNVPGLGDKQTPGYWHRDLGYQHFVSSRPVGVTALFCIDDFNEETGATRVLPGTHKIEAFPSDAYVDRHEEIVHAAAGSVIIFDAMMYHRAGANRSNRVRRAINTTYTIPLIRPQINLPKFLNGKGADDALLRRLLGYDTQLDDSVLAFRRRRLERARATASPDKR